MAKDLHFQTTPLAEEFEVGDDSDLPGFDQPFTQDDIDAILNSPGGTLEERQETLRRMLDDLRARSSMDEADEYGSIIDQVRGALATLAEPADGVGTPGAFAFDPDDRALAPDEILERAEEEQADLDD